MNTFFFFMMVITMFAVAGVLVAGLVVMSKGGEPNKKYGNKLMQARVILQGIAIMFFLLTMASRGH